MSQSIEQNNVDKAVGYASLDQEIELASLPISGTIPSWLEGSLLRNGPAKFEVGEQRFNHWFDGFAMLHRFTFQHGQVAYANKFLQSDSYVQSMQAGKIVGAAFGTDPCKAVFKRTQSEIVNANVSINRIAGDFVALTESPLPIRFDPHTLDTLGVVQYDDNLTGQHGSAHPHHDGQGRLITFMTEFGPQSEFKVFAVRYDEPSKRELIGSLPVDQPSYIHGFSISEHYIIIAEYPYRVNPQDLQRDGKPFIENFKWLPEQDARFVVMDKQDGHIVRTFNAEGFFSFHHVNAFEQDGAIFVDISAYADAQVIQGLYLDQLIPNHNNDNDTHINTNQFRRYRLPLSGDETYAHYELLTTETIELPTINYRQHNARAYRVAYGISSSQRQQQVVDDRLIRVDVQTHQAINWSEVHCYPGEPIFVPTPDAQDEDDGVILSIVLNAHKKNSFLLVLDAKTFQEIGRAEVPHHIPFGFHGLFFPNVQ